MVGKKYTFDHTKLSGREKKEAKYFYEAEILEANSVEELIAVVKEIRMERESLGAPVARELEFRCKRKAWCIVREEQKKELTKQAT